MKFWFAGFLKMKLNSTFKRMLLNGYSWWKTTDKNWNLRTVGMRTSTTIKPGRPLWVIGILQRCCFSRKNNLVTTYKQVVKEAESKISLSTQKERQDCILIGLKSFGIIFTQDAPFGLAKHLVSIEKQRKTRRQGECISFVLPADRVFWKWSVIDSIVLWNFF